MNVASVERLLVLSLVFSLFEFLFVFVFALVFRFATREFALFELRLLLLSLVILAIANTRITSPIPKNTRTAPIPRIHGQALRLCGCAIGIGDQAGGGGGGGVSDGVAPG